jgi:pathogenesis-related protein 1
VKPLTSLLPVLVLAACGGGGDGNPNDGGHTGHDGTHQMVMGEPAELSGITSAHNAVRANASPTPQPALPPLTWSNDLAEFARDWAENCEWEHSDGPCGENLYASNGYPITGNLAVDSWEEEADDYNYSTGNCSGVCGHYTQVVWRGSTQVGCAYKRCPAGGSNGPFGASAWDFIVCNYDPPGNFGDDKPY